MAKQQEEIIIDIQIDQKDLVAEANKARVAIIGIREEQAKLNKEYKNGSVSVEEYAQQSGKLEAQLKDERDSLKDLDKAMRANEKTLDGMRAKLAKMVSERNKLDFSNEKGKKQFDALTKSIEKLNTEIKNHEQNAGDFRRDVGNYRIAMKEAAQEIDVAGVNVGTLSSNMTKFLNPLTATVAGVTALVSAYASSTVGANDLRYANARLSYAFDSINESLATAVGGSGRRGEGLFSKFVDVLFAIGQYAPALAPFNKFFRELALDSLMAADAVDRLTELEIELINQQGLAKFNEQQAELNRLIRDNIDLSLEERLAATENVTLYLEAAGAGVIEVLKEEIDLIKQKTVNYANNLEAQKQVAEIEREIRDKEEEITGKLTENVMSRREILRLLKEQRELEAFIARDRGAPRRTARFTQQETINGISEQVDVRPEGSPLVDQARIGADMQVSIQETLNRDLLKLNEDLAIKQIKIKREAEYELEALDKQRLQSASNVIGMISSLFSEQSVAYKVFAETQNIIDTYRAATAALAPPPVGAGPVFGPFLAAATIAAGLGNAAKIANAGFESGGYTGVGRNNEPAGIVHRNEVVWNAQDVAAVGGPTAANLMRPTAKSRNSRGRGYQDGGIVKNLAVQETNNQVLMANAFKNMPPAEVSVKEITKVQKRISVKQTNSRK